MTLDGFDVDLPHGITLSCRAQGPQGAPLIVFLHGFPEAAFAWDGLLARFGDRYRCVAPNLRGYERSSAPADVKDYRPKHLVADIVALIDRLGSPVEALVAHDWGGALAWNLAAQHPDRLKRLFLVNAAHPGAFLRDLRSNPAQQAASRYMNLFRRPDAEAVLRADDYAQLWRSFEGFGRINASAWLTDERRARYRQLWDQGLTGPLNYYRASPLHPPEGDDDKVLTLQLPDEVLRVTVPTTLVWGMEDGALLPGLLEGLEAWVPDLTTVRVPGASHWIVHEQPERVAQELDAALQR